MQKVHWNSLRYSMLCLFSNVSDVSSNQISVRLQGEWNDDYAIESSSAYTNLKNRIETEVSKQLAL